VETQNGSAATTSRRAGEVVGTSVAEFEAQASKLHAAPPIGTLVSVRLDPMTVYAVVAGSWTDGIDVGARPVLRGRDGCEDAQIYQAHPDLEFVLRTCFRSLVVGFRDGSGRHQYLPPIAVPIHYSVTVCSHDEVERFAAEMHYFRTLLEAQNAPNEDVIATHIRLVASISSPPRGPSEYLVRAGREVATLLRDDHQRLRAILQRIRPAETSSSSMLA